MPYVHVWDESTPPGSTPADQIDTVFQNMKASLRERLEQVIPDFGDDLVNPKMVKAVLLGEVAARPVVDSGGFIFIATDEDIAYYSEANGDWAVWPGAGGGASVLRGLSADRPNPATADFFFATDTNVLWVNNGAEPAAYVQVGSGGTVPEIVNVTYAQLKKVTVSGESLGIVCPHQTDEYEEVLLGPSAINYSEGYIIIAFRWQIRKAGQGWPAEWAYAGKASAEPASFTHAELTKLKLTKAGIGSFIHYLIAGFNFYANDVSGVAQTIDLRFDAYLLALA